ncbi:unnamed protein product [Protopolystoma xenopodis]|uniref:Uncharacterized protein n=1 Tax=Protopolystoma xenopodis TaxID=117903 RepID=A0A448X7J9_9PLAT|nr:unnamed protein product [Protopolystoma xenopodis]
MVPDSLSSPTLGLYETNGAPDVLADVDLQKISRDVESVSIRREAWRFEKLVAELYSHLAELRLADVGDPFVMSPSLPSKWYPNPAIIASPPACSTKQAFLIDTLFSRGSAFLN